MLCAGCGKRPAAYCAWDDNVWRTCCTPCLWKSKAVGPWLLWVPLERYLER